MKTVLVTGASGFLGRAIVNRLSAEPDYHLVAVTSQEHTFPKSISAERIDLLDTKAVQMMMERVCPDICLHLAWDQRTSAYRNAPTNYHWLAASVSLFAQFQAVGGRQFLFAGTSGEYEAQSGRMLEHPQQHSISLYGRCKKAVSDLLIDTGKVTGVQIQIPRYFTIYGPGDTHSFGAIPSAVCSLLRRESFACHSPGAVRDYIYIDDAVEATIRLLNSDFSGVMNIASGIPRSMREVFDEISKQLDCQTLVSYGKETGSEPILTADTRLMRQTLGEFPQMAFGDGIANTISYWRTHLGGK